MHSLPAQHQTDPAKLPGQIINPHPRTDQEVYRFMNRPTQAGTVGEYARRKMDNEPGMPVTPGEALCSRILR
jgi:hypothetical protein